MPLLSRRSRRCVLAAAAALTTVVVVPAAVVPANSAMPAAQVVEVPSRPAFVRPLGRTEVPARSGQTLPQQSLLRTQKPGRMQVRLPDGRSFRLGGDALLRLNGRQLELQQGQIIAWVNPGSKGGAPLQIRTRVATASIVGTTVFIEASDDQLKVFSWEGTVLVETDAGQRYSLRSGEQLSYAPASGWAAPRLLSRAELDTRRERSILLNGFQAPMETLPVIQKELGFSR